MYLNENAQVSSEVRRILNNGFHREHNFNGGNLEEMISIYQEMRNLPPSVLKYCADTVKQLVDREEKTCNACYGKGLAYLKFLTNGILAEESNDAVTNYHKFVTSREKELNLEEEVRDKMRESGINA
jgi:hypothetical protein